MSHVTIGPMHITTLLIDLDDTVYPTSSGLWTTMRSRIDSYMCEVMRIPCEEVPLMRQQLYRTYGTTLRGLQMTRNIDEKDYLAYVHNVPLANYIQPDPELRRVLLSLPQRKVIFTNADSAHAHRVLATLNLSDCFESIIDVLDITPYCKPMPQAYLRALELAGEADPQRVLVVDDAAHNLAAARALGCWTVQAESAEGCAESHAHIHGLAELPQALELIEREYRLT